MARAAIVAIALSAGTTGIAFAQTAPEGAQPVPYATSAPLPSYARPVTDQQITGRISAITGKYTLLVHDDRGFISSVTMHQGTIITPTGLTLQPGMQVTISGTPNGTTFAANRIDTPFTVTVVPGAPAFGWGWGAGWGWGGWGRWGWGWGWGPAWGSAWGPGFGGVWW